MNTRNFFHLQKVLEAELDTIFTQANTEEALSAAENGLAQNKATDTPDMKVFGGILEGLVVTKIDATTVQVTAGAARDDDGKKILLPSTATVSLTMLDETTIGDTTAATGDGSAVAVTAGNEAWLSLFIEYAELLSDARIDGLGNTVYFQIDESFQFVLTLGTEAVAPATNQAAIGNGKVHLADILLDANEQIRTVGATIAIGSTNEFFDLLGVTTPGYEAMIGRRSDWAAFENATDFPLFAAEDTYIRAGNPRAAIYDLVKKLQVSSGSPSGAELIGSLVRTGARSCQAEHSPLSLVAGGVDAQILAILTELNKKVGRGPDLHQAFHDHFMYAPRAGAGAFDPDADTLSWGANVGGVPGGTYFLQNMPTGVLRINSGALQGTWRGIQTGCDPVGGAHGWWVTDTAPFPIAAFKLAPVDTVDSEIWFGLADVVNSAWIAGYISMGAYGPNLTNEIGLVVLNSSGGGTVVSTHMTNPAIGHWWEYYIEVLSNTQARLRVVHPGGVWISSTISPSSGNFGNGKFAAFVYTKSFTGGTSQSVSVDIDAVSVGYSGIVPPPT